MDLPRKTFVLAAAVIRRGVTDSRGVQPFGRILNVTRPMGTFSRVFSSHKLIHENQYEFGSINKQKKIYGMAITSLVSRRAISAILSLPSTYSGSQTGFVRENCSSISRQFTTSTSSLAKKAQKNKAKTKKLSLNEDEAEGIVNLRNLKDRMEDVLDEINQELAAKVPLRITSGFIDNIMVEIGKGKKTPLYQIAQVKTNNDSFTIEIQDVFPNAGKIVTAAINDTGFNMQPSVKGNTITFPIPKFSHDHRCALEKIAKGIANQGKDALRKVRQKGMVDIRNNKEGQSKDLIHRIESQVQQLTDHYNEKIELILEKKVKEMNK